VRGAVAQLWDTTHGEIIVSGPAGTGKTRAILEWIHWRCQTGRVKVLMVRKVAESLKTSALDTYQNQVLHEFDGKRSHLDGVAYFGGNDILPPSFNYQTGSRIVVGGMDQASKIKSTEWDIVFPNECTELSLEDWEMITGRTDRPSIMDRPPALVIGDCNPDAPTHWVKQRELAGSVVVWYSKHEDNPAMWNSQAQRWTASGERYLARLDKLTGVRYKRLRLGQWVAAEGLIYEDWDEAVNVIDRRNLPDEWDRFLVIDFGYTNPFVLGCWAIDPDGRLILEHEIYRTRRLVSDHAADWRHFWGDRRPPIAVIADHDAEDRATWDRDSGLASLPAVKRVSAGIQAVANRIRVLADGKPRLMVMRDTLIHPPDPDLKASGKPTCTHEQIPYRTYNRSRK
jgi:phage terminase large subunit